MRVQIVGDKVLVGDNLFFFDRPAVAQVFANNIATQSDEEWELSKNLLMSDVTWFADTLVRLMNGTLTREELETLDNQH